jgi:hypothetical protein
MVQVARADQVVAEARLQVRAESQLQPAQIFTEIMAVHPMATAVQVAVVPVQLA